MWAWLKNLMSSKDIVVVKTKELPETGHPYRLPGVEPTWYPPVPPPPVKTESNLLGIIRGAVEELAEEQVKLQQKHLNNDLMRVYFQKAMKTIISKLNRDDYDFVLVHQSDVNIPSEAFPLFMQIFCKACKQIGIEAKPDASYVNVDKASVKKLIKTIPTQTPRIDIDERVRAMLGTNA